MKTYNWQEKYDMPGVSCLHKWQWNSIRLARGTSSSCHRVVGEKIDINNFKDFHNTEGAIIARKKMLDGVWPGNFCEYCRDIEEAGGISDRLKINTKEKWAELLTPHEFQSQHRPLYIETPTILEVFFSNLCNMACVYCDGNYSSKWDAEAKKHNIKSRQQNSSFLSQEEYKQMKDEFWKWMESNCHKIISYNILGGEPFFQPELWENIEFFENHPQPQLHVIITTNLKVDFSRLKSAIDRFKNLIVNNHLASIEINCSIDGWGVAEEYVRYGLNLTQWKTNFDYVMSMVDQVRIKARTHMTLCNLNIKCAHQLLDVISEYPVSPTVTMSLTDGQHHLDTRIFDSGFFDEDFDKLKDRITDENQKKVIDGFKDRSNYYPKDVAQLDKLIKFLEDTDSRRGLNWKETFPWLAEYVNNNYNLS